MKYYAVKTNYGFQVIEGGTAGRHYGIGEVKEITEAQASYLVNLLNGIFTEYHSTKLTGMIGN